MTPITAKQIQEEILRTNTTVLEQARATLDATGQQLEHARRLQRTGFTGSKDTRVLKAHAQAQATVQLHERYAQRYPGLKFIAEEVMRRVCKSYSLVIVGPERYTGTVPPWAAKAIEANLHLVRPYRPQRTRWGRLVKEKVKLMHEQGAIVWAGGGPCAVVLDNVLGMHEGRTLSDGSRVRLDGTYTPVRDDHAVLVIAAPESDVQLYPGERIRDGRIVAKDDPIVCLHVAGGYVVLAAWGAEGQDPEVFNAGLN